MVTRFKCVLFCFLKELNINPLVYIALNLANKAPWWLQPPLHSDHKHFMRKSGRDNRETSLPFEGPDSRKSTQSSDSLVSSSWEQSLRDSLQRWASYYYYIFFTSLFTAVVYQLGQRKQKTPTRNAGSLLEKLRFLLLFLLLLLLGGVHSTFPDPSVTGRRPLLSAPPPPMGKRWGSSQWFFNVRPLHGGLSQSHGWPNFRPPFSSFKYKPMIQPLPITSMTRSRRRRVRLLLPPTPQ